ncbi:MAG: hypothetical protein HQL31_09030 [Planctomycetes bacterium]|nr:hypothetical protein [Planctomycetota bacterium]
MSSRNIGINEGMTGSGAMLGVMLGDLAMRCNSGERASIYAMCVVSGLLIMALQFGLMKAGSRREFAFERGAGPNA